MLQNDDSDQFCVQWDILWGVLACAKSLRTLVVSKCEVDSEGFDSLLGLGKLDQLQSLSIESRYGPTLPLSTLTRLTKVNQLR